MVWLLYGVLALGVLVLVARWFVDAEPRQIVRLLRWLGIALAAAVLGFLAMRGLWPLFVPLLMGALMYLRRRRAQGGRSAWSGLGGSQPSGKTSEVRTESLRMTLDHDSGSLDGTILRGQFAGRTLGTLAEAELIELRDACRDDDPESVQLIETYLDRRLGPEWRQGAEGSAEPPAASTGPMTREEAFAVLGLEPGASDGDIREAHHRLMKKVHPDQGGSTFLATKINQAKDLLLGDR